MANLSKYLDLDPSLFGAECAGDAQLPSAELRAQLDARQGRLAALAADAGPLARGDLLLDIGRLQNQLEQHADAWESGKQAFELYAAEEEWEGAVQACDILFLAEQPGSLAALGHGIWLGVTYPVDPELSIAMLDHLVEATPDNADGAAVAAAAAHYIADLRTPEGSKARENLLFFTSQMMAQVARRHSNIEEQVGFGFWVKKLELDDPARFLPRLAQIVDVLVQDDWWLDRDALRAKLPVH